MEIKTPGFMQAAALLIFAAATFFGPNAAGKDLNMKIASPAFADGADMPSRFTCEGLDINPELIIENVPAGTKSLVLIVDDPDAPMKTWIHWVVYDIPPVGSIAEDSVPGKQGANDFGRLDWGGPCPPSGKHRYYFRIYALDSMLGLNEGVDRRTLEKAMEGHVLGKAELVGLYKRSGKRGG
jgi:Raf kinase inhibitor-like YbhB/YbcL family protein